MIDGEKIDEVEKTKFIGIIIDNKLNWKKTYLIHYWKSLTGFWYGYTLLAKSNGRFCSVSTFIW